MAMERRYCPSALVLLAGALACYGPTVPEGIPPPPPPQFRIEPGDVGVLVGQSVQFRVAPVTTAAITWQLDAGSPGSISADGLFSSPLCGSTGTAGVRARIDVQPAQTPSARAHVTQLAVGLVNIAKITYTATALPVRLDSLAGTVDVQAQLAGAPLTCLNASAVYLETVVGTATTVLDSLSFTPPLEAASLQTLRWNTGLVPNGPYALRIRVRTPEGNSPVSNSVPVQVRNP